MYTYDSMEDLTSKLQNKVNEMTQEMTDKSEELEAHIEEAQNLQGTFESIESDIQALLDSINEMNDFQSRIEEAVSEADNLIN